ATGCSWDAACDNCWRSRPRAITTTSGARSAPSSRSTGPTTRYPWCRCRSSSTWVATADPRRPMRALPDVTARAPVSTPVPTRRHRATFLPFAPPLVGQEEIDEVVDTLRSDWITTGPKTRRFETEFAAYLGAPGALALSSCTAGLHTALVTLGIGPGAEVVTTPMTFAASVNVIEHVGARPVLVDVEPDTLNLDPGLVAAALTPRTRAILPVHYAGHPAALDPIGDIARPGGLAVIEDAAHALPAKYKGRPIGSGANPVAFSLYPTKNMTTAEGGMLTGDAALLERARTVSLHGMTRHARGPHHR